MIPKRSSVHLPDGKKDAWSGEEIHSRALKVQSLCFWFNTPVGSCYQVSMDAPGFGMSRQKKKKRTTALDIVTHVQMSRSVLVPFFPSF